MTCYFNQAGGDLPVEERDPLLHPPCPKEDGKRPKAFYEYRGQLQELCVMCVTRAAEEYMEENGCDRHTAFLEILQ